MPIGAPSVQVAHIRRKQAPQPVLLRVLRVISQTGPNRVQHVQAGATMQAQDCPRVNYVMLDFIPVEVQHFVAPPLLGVISQA